MAALTPLLFSFVSAIQLNWAEALLMVYFAAPLFSCRLDSSVHGVWSLTDKGLKAVLNDNDLLKLYELKKKWEKEDKQIRALEKEAEEEGEQVTAGETSEGISYCFKGIAL